MANSPKKTVGSAMRVWNAHGGLPRARIAIGHEARLRLEGGPLVLVRYREHLSAGTARLVLGELQDAVEPAVVLADRSTVAARRLLHEHGVGVVDGAGTARLSLPGLIVHTDPVPARSRGAAPRTEPSPKAPAADARRGPDGRLRRVHLRGRSALVGRALLLWPGVDWHLQDLAARCGLSPSPVHFVLRRLEEDAILLTEGRGPRKTRRLVAREALLDLLAEEHEDRGAAHATGHRTEQGADVGLTAGVAAALQTAGVPYAVTGAAALEQMLPARSTAPATVWVGGDVPLTELLALVGARPDPRPANVELRRARDASPLAFSRTRDGVRLADHVRIYLDLIADPDHDPSHAGLLRRALVSR